MKWDDQRFDELIRRPTAFRVILLHGDDVVLVAARARLVAQAIQAAGSGMFPPAELASSEHSRIGAELASPMLGGDHRLVRLRDATDQAANSAERALDGPGGATLLIESASLPARSPMRKAVESSDRGVAIACRGLDGRAVARSVDRMMAEAGLQLGRDARAVLLGLETSSGVSSGDPHDRLQDAEKLILLMAGSPEPVEAGDVQALQVGAGRGAMDDLSFAVAAGRLRDADHQMEDLLSDGVAPATILRSLINHFGRLRAARRAVDGGNTLDAAVAAVRPPVFFRRVPEMLEAVKRWGADDLDAACVMLWRADRVCRETGSPAASICRRVVESLVARERAAHRQ